MNKILFSTGNQRKIKEARDGCALFGIEVEPVTLDFHEIQSHDPIEISKHKAEEAFRLAGNKPIVVADTSWNIPSLNGFPGGYMKDVHDWFEAEDFISLVAKKTDKTIIFRETVVYKDANEVKVFSKEYTGAIVDAPRGVEGNSLEMIAEFDGLTLAESHDKGRSGYNPEEFIWYEFAKWLSGR